MRQLLVSAVAVVTLGMATPSSAADLAARPYTKAPVPAVAAAYSWTGFYFGGNVGWSESRTNTANTSPFGGFDNGVFNSFDANSTSWTGGLQAGYNWQMSNVVFGIEGDLGYLDNERRLEFIGPNADDFIEAKFGWYGTVTGRLGLAFNNSLFYVKGGAAFGRVENTAADLINNAPGPFLIDASDVVASSSNRTGYAVGGGWEYGFSPNWSGKIEYLYLDFGRYESARNLDGDTFTHRNNVHTVKFGINYHFNSPVVARY
jgi:outer membrane immunogenic protein